MGLRGYVARRSIELVVSLILFMILMFYIFRLMPGDPTAILIEESTFSAELRERLRHLWGLDKPIHEQFMIYVYNLLHGELGISFVYNEPVAQLIFSRKLLNTLALLTASHGMALAIGMVLGVWAAWRRGKTIDVSSLITALVLYTIPVFWLGLMFLLLFAVYNRWFPLGGTITPA
ncbi:MAG: ABC transporter permease, partial [Pyrodictiaceae archaeon]